MRRNAYLSVLLLLLSMVWSAQPVTAQVYQPDRSDESRLITNVVADPQESQLTSNCTWKITDPGNDNYSFNEEYIKAGNELGALIDGDETTYWHSDPTGPNLNTQDLYIQVDLKRTDIRRFYYEYNRRGDVYNGGVRRGILWTRIEVKATNTPADNSSWVTVALHDNLPLQSDDNATWPYMPPMVEMPQAYRYLRFYARYANGYVYWCMSEFQMYPAVEVTDPHEKLTHLVDSIGPGAFEVGTDPGYYPADKVKTFEDEWDKAQKLADSSSATDEQLTAQEKALRDAMNEVLANKIPVTNGYYRIVSSYAGFLNSQNVEKAIYANTLENRMAWKTLDESNPYQVFKVTRLPSGNYSIQCVANTKYIDWVAGDACNDAAAYNLPLSDEQSTEQIIAPDVEHNTPWFCLYNVKNNNSYHMLSHGNGTGEEGWLCAANVTYNECNYWYLRRVDDATGESMAQEGMRQTYATLLNHAVEKAESVRKQANDYEALIHEADDEDDEHNQFSSNARWTYKDAATGGQGAYANLIDGSHETYFHSRYPASAVAGYHYLQVDLKRTDINEFIFKMLRRGDGNWRDNWNQLPNDIEIWVTNDASAVDDPTPIDGTEAEASPWKKVAHLNSGFPALSSHEYYTSPVVSMGGAYQYVRFVVLNTVNGPGYFNMSEFQMYDTKPTESSEYYTVKGMKEVCDQLDAELAKAKEKVTNMTAEKNDTAIIYQLARQIQALYVDRAGINKTLGTYLTQATAVYKTAFTFDNLLTDAQQEDGQITCNAPADNVTYASLIDNNLGTYFENKNVGEMNKSSVYLEFDLRRTDISKLNFEFYGVASNYKNPNAIDVYVSNDASDESSWKRFVGLTDGFDTNKPNAHYISPDIDLGQPYQYIRLYPMGSATDDYVFNMAEIQFHSTTPNEATSQYYYVKGLKEAADHLQGVIATVQDKVNRGMAIDLSDTTAINEATSAVRALVFDPSEYRSLAGDVAALLADTYNVGKAVGQYPAEAVTALKEALDQANGMVDYDKVDREKFTTATTLLTQAKKDFKAKQVGVDTHMWYTIKYPSEEYFESRGWDIPSWWAMSNPFYDQYIAPGLRTEDNAEVLTADDVSAGDCIYYFTQDDIANEPTAAQWRFVEVGKGKYALQNRLSGLFINSGTDQNSTTMQLTPSLATVRPLGYGQCSIDLSTITGSSLGTYHYLNGRGNEIANQVGTWSAVGTSQPDNSLFVIEAVEAIDEATYAPSFAMSQLAGDQTPLCFPTEIKSIEGVTAYTAAGTMEKDGTKYIALNEAEMPIKAGQPFFLISDEDYDGVSVNDVRMYPGSNVVSKAGSMNGLTGVFTRTTLDEGLVWIGATEAKAVDNVTTATEAGSAYMKYGSRIVNADSEYDRLLPISGTPRNYDVYDLDKHAGTQDDPYPVSDANELMALYDLMHTGQMTYVILDEDIDMSGEDWNTLNREDSHYDGKTCMNFVDFDGRGHVISNLTSKGHRYASVFGILCGNLRNVGFENVDIDCTETGSGVLGGYVGHPNYTDASGNLLPSTVENVWVTGKLHVASSYCGGLFGNIGGPTTIKNCYANVDITSEATFQGGLIGRVRDALTMENVYVAGTCTGSGVVGGGQNEATPASTYRNVVVWNNTSSDFGTTASGDVKEGISNYDGTNFAALQETVVGWGRAWYCDMQEGSYPTLIANGIGLLLDVVFNEDGTATDISPMKNKVEVLGTTPATYWSDKYNRYVAKFDTPMGKTPEGLYKVNYESNSTFRKALASGHSLEMLIKADAEVTDVAKPFSSMQTGGTGFETAEVNGKHVIRFNPNVSTDGSNTWGRVDSDVQPQVNEYVHVLGVWNKQEQKAYIYINGQLASSKTLEGDFNFPAKNNCWFGIGGDPSGASKATNAWQGDVVIARVYADALTADEATALWNDVKGGTGIQGVSTDEAGHADTIYTINGIRVQKTHKGLYIINGKKVMVK